MERDALRRVSSPSRVRSAAAALLLGLALSSCGPGAKPPELELKGVSFNTDTDLTVALRLRNPNRFALNIAGVDYTLYVGNNACGFGSRTEPLALKPGAAVDAEFPLKIDYANLARSLPLLFRDTVRFSVAGDYRLWTPVGQQRLSFADTVRTSVRGEVESLLNRLLGADKKR
jgi:LEA14-like dessication related protein